MKSTISSLCEQWSILLIVAVVEHWSSFLKVIQLSMNSYSKPELIERCTQCIKWSDLTINTGFNENCKSKRVYFYKAKILYFFLEPPWEYRCIEIDHILNASHTYPVPRTTCSSCFWATFYYGRFLVTRCKSIFMQFVILHVRDH